MSWPNPSLEEVERAATAFCATPWDKMQTIARDDSKAWEDFMGDGEQRAKEFPERCLQAAYIDLLLGRVYGIPRSAHNLMVRLQFRILEHSARLVLIK